ncbi:MAG: hypothetical protein HYV47_02465 [Candidatus Nealsonbacteria bacterium]|nr:hypothetical protein [Candidatus Nealsonbacteria bacterium]
MIKNQKGFATFFVTILIFTVVFSISASIFILTYGEQKIIKNIVKSSQSYYAAETGLEDAILRLKKSMNLPSSYSIAFNGVQAQVSLQSPNVNTRIITSDAVDAGISRKLEMRVAVETIKPQFFYGAQVGTLGIEMENNSRIEGAGGTVGNIYSNGPIEGDGGATITGDVFIAAGALDDVVVLGSVHANTIDDSKICGNAYYQTIDSSSLDFLNNPRNPTCPDPLSPGNAYPDSSDPPLQNMPISDSDIAKWKQDAAAGGIYSGDLTVNSNMSYGPKQINGNLIMTSNNKILTVTGTLYITGYLDIDNGSTIRCDAAYGLNSCIVMVDKWVHTKNNGIFQGSGSAGSYIMILSNSNCLGSSGPDCTHHDSAIDLHNNASGAIFYANNGLIYLHNGVEVSELTAKKIQLNQGAIVRYEQGLVNAEFSAGPGGAWDVTGWKEIE